MLHTHRNLHVALNGKTNRRILGTVQKQCSVGSRRALDIAVLPVFFTKRSSASVYEKEERTLPGNAPNNNNNNNHNNNTGVGRDSSVGIATRYELDGPGIEFRFGRDFRHPSRPALEPTQPLVQGGPGHSRG
jgi:hypothetical protein